MFKEEEAQGFGWVAIVNDRCQSVPLAMESAFIVP